MFETSFTDLVSPADEALHAEIQASIERLFSSGDWASYRSQVLEELKAEIAQQIGVSNVRLCSSGSFAMELALRGCGLSEGDEVICPALDYPGNIRAVRLLHAMPVVVDAAAGRWTIDVEQVENAGNDRTRAVIVSHLYGEIADVERLRTLCDERGWSLIEDVCQLPGGIIAGRALGSFGHVGAFSFGGSKPLTAGSGGAVVTSDRRISQRITAYLDRPSDAAAMSPLQAAVLLPQWRRLDSMIVNQQANLRRLIDGASSAMPRWKWPSGCQADRVTCYYKIPIELVSNLDSPESNCEIDRRQILDALELVGRSAGLPFRVITKVTNGRGCLHSYKNAENFALRNILLDHRCVAGSSESVIELANQLIAVHDGIYRR